MMPLLSIIIPTKNRTEYCLKTLSHILSLGLSELQVIIQDNSDDDQLRKHLSMEISENRITYNYSSEQLNMSQNFQATLRHIAGEYFMFIGDDDSINPQILEIVKFFKHKGAQAIVQNYPIYFVYPNIEQNTSGEMSFFKASGSYKKININKEIDNLVKNSFQEYTYTALPRPYHGIIKSEIITNINKSELNLFSGVSPDIYSAVILSQFITSVYKIDLPFSIAGACPQSASSLGDNKKHCGRVEDAIHFKGRKVLWSKYIPRFYSVQTIWALAAVEALIDLGKKNILKDFNANKLTAKALVKNWSIRTIIFTEFFIFSNKNYLNVITLLLLSVYELFCLYLLKIKNRFRLLVAHEIIIIKGVNSFSEVLEYYNKLNKNSLNLK
jgi:glycosyltransferase involved in cell wall biosynthesis